MRKKSIGKVVFALILTSILAKSFNTALATAETKSAGTSVKRLVIGVDRAKPYAYGGLRDRITLVGGKIVDTVSIKGEVIALVVEIPLNITSAFKVNMKATGLASYVENGTQVEALIVPNDANWTEQWGPKQIEADWAWNFTTGSSDILVAIVDTGIDKSHPDLSANYVSLGYDWVNYDDHPVDDHGHGTHCAGIIAAEINNTIGVAGLAQVRIMAEKVLDQDGTGWSSWVANGIIHATDQGADIISMSLGGSSYSELLHDAVRYAHDSGVLVLAAAGNDATDLKHYPAGYDEVIAVAATDHNDDAASFSNLGDWIEVSAPGVNVFSTYWDGSKVGEEQHSYRSASGTSMACPHVAGIAALTLGKYPNLKKDSLRYWLRHTTDDLGLQDFDMYYGHGRINAHTAVKTSRSDYDLVALSLDAPPVVEASASRVVKGTILNLGNESQTNVEVQLLSNGTCIGNTTLSSLPRGNSTTIDFSWTPTIGVFNLTLQVAYEPEFDEIPENNFRSKNVTARFPTTLNVPSDYSSVQAALHESIPKDTINVSAGIYYGNIVIDKADVKLIGESRESTTIKEGTRCAPVINVKADNVTVTGFSIHGVIKYGLMISGSRCCIEINGCNGINISSNNIEKALWGIGILSSNNVVIEGNYVANNEFGGIHGDNLNNIVISNNTITEHRRPVNYEYYENKYGLRLQETYGSNITDNNLTRNQKGVFLTSFHSNTVNCNNVSNNQLTGIRLEGNNNTFNGNAVINNGWEPESSPLPEPLLYGIFLYSAHGNTMRNNRMVNNTSFNFRVFGDSLEHYIQDIDTSNTVDRKPIYYWVNRQNEQVFPRAGYVALVNCSNINATGLLVHDNSEGILLVYTINSSITDNTMTGNRYGIFLVNSSSNIIARNDITANEVCGIHLSGSSENKIYYNTVRQSFVSLWAFQSSNNMIFHNGFSSNSDHAYSYESVNVWDNSYPSGGNYWGDYTVTDNHSGPYQNETGSDGIGDTPYIIDDDNLDRYPLMEGMGHDLMHDIAVTDLAASATNVSPGETVQISVEVQNLGDFTETFTLRVYVVGGETIWGPTTITLSPGQISTQSFQWTAPTTPGDYTIRAEASMVPGEIDTANNAREITITVSEGGGGGGGGGPIRPWES